jgi:hypothetical protein
MNRVCWWLADMVSRLLERGECDAVRGDLAESGATGGAALRDLLGLVVRRQAALWNDWRPWLALVGLVGPLGVLLSQLCKLSVETSAIYAWLYVNNWTWTFLASPGARSDLAHYSAGFFLDYVTLMCWSWTCGFVVGSLSRRAVGVNGAVFSLVVFGELLAVPQHHNGANDVVFSLTFYSVVFPVILRSVLVLFPALWGMHQGLRRVTLPLLQTIAGSVAVATLTARATGSLHVSGIWGWWPLVRTSSQLPVLSLVLMWPAGYIVATASWRRWHDTTGVG